MLIWIKSTAEWLIIDVSEAHILNASPSKREPT